MKYVTKKDIVIPAGTEFYDAPTKTERWSAHIEGLLELGPNNVVSVVVPVEADEAFDNTFEQA